MVKSIEMSALSWEGAGGLMTAPKDTDSQHINGSQLNNVGACVVNATMFGEGLDSHLDSVCSSRDTQHRSQIQPVRCFCKSRLRIITSMLNVLVGGPVFAHVSHETTV
jgi:hypothetical protein